MGMRGQVLIEDTGVYLYTHWDAESLEGIVTDTIKLKRRWSDPEYLGRMIFSRMVQNHLLDSCCYGIGTTQDEDIDILVRVNCEQKWIRVVDPIRNKTETYKFTDICEEGIV